MKTPHFSYLVIRVLLLVIASPFAFSSVYAFAPKEMQAYFNGPSVQAVGTTSAVVTLSDAVLGGMNAEEKAGVYLEYFETHKVCIMIYPTPAECLPIKLPVGTLTAALTNLKPNTEYQVSYKHDNTIRCITSPCPENSFESQAVTFTTLPDPAVTVVIDTNHGLVFTQYMSLGSRGSDVVKLQRFLQTRGFLVSEPTGYYGLLTRAAVKKYQISYGISATGSVGPITRKYLAKESL